MKNIKVSHLFNLIWLNNEQFWWICYNFWPDFNLKKVYLYQNIILLNNFWCLFIFYNHSGTYFCDFQNEIRWIIHWIECSYVRFPNYSVSQLVSKCQPHGWPKVMPFCRPWEKPERDREIFFLRFHNNFITRNIEFWY